MNMLDKIYEDLFAVGHLRNYVLTNKRNSESTLVRHRQKSEQMVMASR